MGNDFKGLAKRGLYRFWSLRESSIILLTAVFLIFVHSVNQAYLSSSNITNMLRATSYLLITSCGMTFVLISGNIDLSIPTVMGLGGIIFCMLITSGVPLIAAFIITMIIAAAAGFLNGYLVYAFNIPPMIMTLGMQYIAKGAINILTEGRPVYPLPDAFTDLDDISLFGIPVVAVIAIVIAIVCWIVLCRTKFGREVHAVGGNREAARLSGISVRKTYIAVFVISACLAMFGGIAMSARVGSAQSASGTGYELNSIVACLIGGTSINGGSGGIAGSILGAFFIQALQNGLLMLHVNVYWQQLVIGIIVVLAVIWDSYRTKLQMKKM